jgi:hypothetical protein
MFKFFKISFFSLLVIFSLPGFGQVGTDNFFKRTPPKGVISVIGGLGVGYYMGDLRGDIDVKHLGLGPALSVGGTYRFGERLSARSELRFYQVAADQKYAGNSPNNLSFQANNPDLYIGLQGDFIPYSRFKKFNAYLFGGVGVTYISPRAKHDGSWYVLPKYRTEDVRYSRVPVLLMAGIGVEYQIKYRWYLGLELGDNFLNSDYLDDVSTSYPDLLEMEPIRQVLSDPTGNNEPGFKRGNPGVKDSYIILNFRVRYLLTTPKRYREGKKTRTPNF